VSLKQVPAILKHTLFATLFVDFKKSEHLHDFKKLRPISKNVEYTEVI
jgi:hypothetical protein